MTVTVLPPSLECQGGTLRPWTSFVYTDGCSVTAWTCLFVDGNAVVCSGRVYKVGTCNTYHGATLALPRCMEVARLSEESPVDQLSRLILTRLAELGDENGPMGAREAARRARGLVSYETIRNLARGVRHTGRISPRVAEGLSMALEVPVAQIYRAAGALPPSEQWSWPRRFDALPPAQRQVVEDVAAAMLEMYERGRRNSAG